MGRHDLFRCQLCGRATPPGTRAARVALETRPKEYPFRREANRPTMRNGQPKRDGGRIVYPDDPGGVGREVVREALVCPDCAARGPLPEITATARASAS